MEEPVRLGVTESVVENTGTQITPDEIKRRMNSNVLQKNGIMFQDLEVNQIKLITYSSLYRNGRTSFNGVLGYLRMEHDVFWKNITNEQLLSRIVKRKYEDGLLEGTMQKLKGLSSKDIEIETEVYSSIEDYSLEDTASFFVKVGDGDDKLILRVDYPIHVNDSGNMMIFLNPNDVKLQGKIEILKGSIKVLVQEGLLPNLSSEDVDFRFQGVFDEGDVANRLKVIESNIGNFKSLFDRDLHALADVKAMNGFHRAIVYFLGHNCGLIFLQNTDINDSSAVTSHSDVLKSWIEDPNRSQMLLDTGFVTDSMANYMHTFIKFDTSGKPVWYIDRGNSFPEWFNLGDFKESEIALYLSEKYGIKSEFGIVSEDVSKQLALDGGLGKKIISDASLLESEYGKSFAEKYKLLANKFRIEEAKPYSSGWERFQAMEVLIKSIRNRK